MLILIISDLKFAVTLLSVKSVETLYQKLKKDVILDFSH